VGAPLKEGPEMTLVLTPRETQLRTLLAPYTGTTRDHLGSMPTTELRRRLALASLRRAR
jgi:hypothetical protein